MKNVSIKKKILIIAGVFLLWASVVSIGFEHGPIQRAEASEVCSPEYEDCYPVDDGLTDELTGEPVRYDVGEMGWTPEQEAAMRQGYKGIKDLPLGRSQGGPANDDKPTPENCNYLSLGCVALYVVNMLLDAVGGSFMHMAEGMFFFVVDLTKEFLGGPNQSGILVVSTIGWKATRDVANMFFVLFILWVAIATILSYESYSARALLPKIIVVALLINFSFSISQLIINTSTTLGNFFFASIIKQKGSLNTAFRDMGLNLHAVRGKTGSLNSGQQAAGSIYDKNEDKRKNAEAMLDKWFYGGYKDETGFWATLTKSLCEGYGTAASESKVADIIYKGLKLTVCAQETLNQVAQVRVAMGANPDDGSAMISAYAYRVIIKAFAYPIGVFVILAGVFMLVYRIIALVFVVVLGPIAFLAMTLPATNRYWSMWWDSLVKWSFFYPAFAFFFWLGVTVLGVPGEASLVQVLARIVLGGGFLIGALIVSNKMGIAVAGSSLALGKRMARGGKRWAGRQAMKPTGRAAEAFRDSRIGSTLASIPVLRHAMKAPEAAIRKRDRASALQRI